MSSKQREQPAKKKCFVVCPIGAAGSPTRDHADWLLHEIIKNVLDQYFTGQFELIRSDKIDTPGMIDAQIIEHLLDDDLVIADMTELNANAFYEMGIRHMKELPIIHMFRRGETIPFDVKLYRAIEFDYGHPSDLKEAREALRAAIATVISEDYKVDNPVIRARGVVKLSETASPEIDILRQQMAALEAKVDRLPQPDFPPTKGLAALYPSMPPLWASQLPDPRPPRPWHARLLVRFKGGPERPDSQVENLVNMLQDSPIKFGVEEREDALHLVPLHGYDTQHLPAIEAAIRALPGVSEVARIRPATNKAASHRD